jgi:hypothetical protein
MSLPARHRSIVSPMTHQHHALALSFTIFTSTIISSHIPLFSLSIPSTYDQWFIRCSCSFTYPYPPTPHSIGDSSGANAPLPYPYPPPPLYGYPTYSYPPPPTSGSSGGPASQSYSYPPPPIYLYPPAQPVHSEDDDNLGNGDNTSHTTQALSRMKKRNEWTPTDEEKLVLLNFITSLSCMR